jgi:hypothetical protein
MVDKRIIKYGKIDNFKKGPYIMMIVNIRIIMTI